MMALQLTIYQVDEDTLFNLSYVTAFWFHSSYVCDSLKMYIISYFVCVF